MIPTAKMPIAASDTKIPTPGDAKPSQITIAPKHSTAIKTVSVISDHSRGRGRVNVAQTNPTHTAVITKSTNIWPTEALFDPPFALEVLAGRKSEIRKTANPAKSSHAATGNFAAPTVDAAVAVPNV